MWCARAPHLDWPVLLISVIYRRNKQCSTPLSESEIQPLLSDKRSLEPFLLHIMYLVCTTLSNWERIREDIKIWRVQALLLKMKQCACSSILWTEEEAVISYLLMTQSRVEVSHIKRLHLMKVKRDEIEVIENFMCRRLETYSANHHIRG